MRGRRIRFHRRICTTLKVCLRRHFRSSSNTHRKQNDEHLGLNHERLTYYHNGLERRLTDVDGHVFKEILA